MPTFIINIIMISARTLMSWGLNTHQLNDKNMCPLEIPFSLFPSSSALASTSPKTETLKKHKICQGENQGNRFSGEKCSVTSLWEDTGWRKKREIGRQLKSLKTL